jgi:hypothetical protein
MSGYGGNKAIPSPPRLWNERFKLRDKLPMPLPQSGLLYTGEIATQLSNSASAFLCKMIL